ncbi:DNA polymerase II large subunit [Candidatus Pacearchaeota archaeon]|nr:DNA polymerase II large subunit [Candidatus Pacearchaeota archaeon]
MNIQKYFKDFERDVNVVYSLAETAKAKGLDPVNKVEIPLAKTMAEKCVELIATIYPQMSGCGIDKRILELEQKWGKLDPAVCLQIAEEVAKQKFCKFKSLLEAIEAGARVGFAYITLGVVSSPIEGLTEIKIMKTKEGKEYFSPYYSGPVRSAGGTGAAFSLVIMDHLREIFGYSVYDPNADEIKRAVTELNDYHERVTNLQYMPTEDEIILLMKYCPLQINGDASEKQEVSNYKNLSRVETNFIRSGYCLVLGEGLAQKAAKIKRYITSLREKGFKLSSWDFLEEYIELHEKRDKGKTDDSPTYIKDLVAGRPVFGHPSRSGGFRFRYGRGRVSGFSAASLHPATMAITDGFIATGTQLKIEKPTKGCVATVCDSIDGPIVKLFNGSVKKVRTKDEAKKLYPDVEEIIYLGDILFPFSDLANRNSNLVKPGYVEEWWKLDLEQKTNKLKGNFDDRNVSFEEAIEFSKKYEIPLHPKFIFYWTQISKEEFLDLIKWLKESVIADKKIIFPYYKEVQEKFAHGKRALELLGVEHSVTIENVVIDEETGRALLINLGVKFFEEGGPLNNFIDEEKYNLAPLGVPLNTECWGKHILEIINSVSNFKIKDKAGDFIGARMGRPEKAKLRKLTGSPNILFPVAREGGRLRSVQAACDEGKVRSAFPVYYCEQCKKETIYPTCEDCENVCKKVYHCFECDKNYFGKCEEHDIGVPFYTRDIDMKHYYDKAAEKLGLQRCDFPVLIKGVRGTSSENHQMENLAKGFLRAMYNLQVNKDGTIRFDSTELPLVSFKPKEISVSVEKLNELGYDKDIYGNALVDEEQILELMPHDVILPCSSESLDEKADDVFIKVCNFIDELLVRFYGLNGFYNVKNRDDLVGQLGVCMAPHNCAGVICRFIGFSNTLGLFASPYMHAAIRRDCDGDEAALMLLGDVLINFSKEFLPSHRGGTQDAPLVLNGKIDAGEVDDQILDFELVYEYPLKLYQLAEQRKHSSEINVNTVKSILKEGKEPFVNFGFTHDTFDFNGGVGCSSYKLLPTMQEKVQHQMELVEKIRAADTSDTAKLIIDRHFIKDMKGNLRKFSMQGFRCVVCNKIMRRPPLKGVCSKCGGKIIFTINEGGIKKYLEPALDLANKYGLSLYLKQNLQLVKENIDSIFGKELERQEKLGEWF